MKANNLDKLTFKHGFVESIGEVVMMFGGFFVCMSSMNKYPQIAAALWFQCLSHAFGAPPPMSALTVRRPGVSA